MRHMGDGWMTITSGSAAQTRPGQARQPGVVKPTIHHHRQATLRSAWRERTSLHKPNPGNSKSTGERDRRPTSVSPIVAKTKTESPN